jgi:hypothetical protein
LQLLPQTTGREDLGDYDAPIRVKKVKQFQNVPNAKTTHPNHDEKSTTQYSTHRNLMGKGPEPSREVIPKSGFPVHPPPNPFIHKCPKWVTDLRVETVQGPDPQDRPVRRSPYTGPERRRRGIIVINVK